MPFSRLQKLQVWSDSNIATKTKLLLYKVIVQSTLLYGCETWAVTDRDVHRLEVFQMKCLRRIRGVTLLNRISNDSMLACSAFSKMANLLRYRRLQWLGHVARMSDDRLPKQMLFGTLEGKSAPGRPVKSWNDFVREDLDHIGLTYHWWRKCQDRSPGNKYLRSCYNAPSTFLGWKSV